MESGPERPLIAGFLYGVDGYEQEVIPITGRRGGLVFYRVHRDVHGNVFRGGLSPLQPDASGRLLLDGEPTERTLADLHFLSRGESPGLDPLPST